MTEMSAAEEPAPESWRGDGLRGVLTTTLRGCVYPVDLVGVRDHLLPVVTAWAEQRARERAVEELDRAAEWFARLPDEQLSRRSVARFLRDDADALAADTRSNLGRC